MQEIEREVGGVESSIDKMDFLLTDGVAHMKSLMMMTNI